MFATIEGFYLLAVLPAFFSITIVAQGVYKITHKDSSGWFALGLGVLLLVGVIILYMMVYDKPV